MIKIFTEDSQGKAFFRELIKRLKDTNEINHHLKTSIDSIPGNSPCCSKQTRVFSTVTYFEKIIIIFDSDGIENRNNKIEKMKIHIPQEFSDKFFLILCEEEIEEWICKSLNIDYNNQKPSKALNNYCRERSRGKSEYHKSNLKNYVNIIDIEVLKTIENYSFQLFLNELV